MTDYEGRRRWFREHPSAHYLLNVVLGIVGFVVLGGLLGRLLAPNDPTYGYSWSGIITRAITGSVVMLFVTWQQRRLLDAEPRRLTWRQPGLWLLLAMAFFFAIIGWSLASGRHAPWQAGLAVADGVAMFMGGLTLATDWHGFAGPYGEDALGRRVLGGLCCVVGLMVGTIGLGLLLGYS